MQASIQSESVSNASPSPTSRIGSVSAWPTARPDRPCDACRRRKSRCVINPEEAACVLCVFHRQNCTFEKRPTPRKRKTESQGTEEPAGKQKRSSSDVQQFRPVSHSLIRPGPPVEDYANLQGPSLLKRTLGLQNHRHAKYIGTTAEYDSIALDLRQYDSRGESHTDPGSFRKVGQGEFFHQFADAESPNHSKEAQDLDEIETVVAPHGEALIKLYFRIAHPSFPILHKKVYLEKYSRTHREFIPSLLAAVYILALDWWSFSSELAGSPKPNVEKLEEIAFRTLQDSAHRPKLSTVQAGLLLLQTPGSSRKSTWQMTSQLVAIGQDLGLHRDCTNWRIPAWEKGLRKRLGWALFMQSTWSALIHGRPLHFSPSARNWAVQTVVGSDFPESAADEDDEDGSTEVEKGRTLFCAMISLTRILAEIVETIYFSSLEHELRHTPNGTQMILEVAKPLQQKLRSWYCEIPESLKMESNSRVGKLSSVGWLHTSYFSTEISLHRAIVRSLSANTDPYLIQVCRSAAKERLSGAMKLFNKLKPEHLQSFWYFASKFNFAVVGIFAGLCYATAVTQEEAEFYQRSLQMYRWSLRVSSKSADLFEVASAIVDSSMGTLLESTESPRSLLPLLPDSLDEEEDGEEEDPIDAFLANAQHGFYNMYVEA